MLKTRVVDVGLSELGCRLYAFLLGGWLGLGTDMASQCLPSVLISQGCELHMFTLLFLWRLSNT